MSIPQQGKDPIRSRSQLAGMLEAGCKPRDRWRIGAEHEKFVYHKADFSPVSYAGEASIRAILEELAARFGWNIVREGEAPVGLMRDGANISLEPGGQLELSGAPLRNAHEVAAETAVHIREVKSVIEPMGIGVSGLGAAPHWRHGDMPMMPKGRYKIMREYMRKVGTYGQAMMFRSCTIQTNLDFGSERDMVRKLRAALALQPLATALFASSPFFEGQLTGWNSQRGRMWADLDPDRTGIPDFVFEDGFGFEAWADYALRVPMYFVYRGGVYNDVTGKYFGDFLDGKLPGFAGETPLTSDWADHLTTIFTEARIKTFMEMRGADGGPPEHIAALAAFWAGLLYEETALDAALDLCESWSGAGEDGGKARVQLREDCARFGFRAMIDGRSVGDILAELLEISAAGLTARAKSQNFAADETPFLAPLQRLTARGENLADEMQQRFREEWGQDASRALQHMAW